MIASLRAVVSRIRGLFAGRRLDSDFEQELEAHLALLTEENIRTGMEPGEARRAARLKLGGAVQLRESHHDQLTFGWFESLAQDIRFAMRMLRKNPGFTVVAVLTLALGIGANTAIFSLVDWLILRPLPIDQPSGIALLFSTSENGGAGTTFSYPEFLEIQKQTSSVFSGLSAVNLTNIDGLRLDGKSEPILTSYVSGNFFDLLGIKPAQGRLIIPSEGSVAGADPVLVISYAYWKSHFNADPSVIGERATVNGQPITIIGVTPQGFHGLTNVLDTQGYMPLAMAAAFKDARSNFLSDAKYSAFIPIARLKPGVSVQQTQPALQIVAQRLSELDHSQNQTTIHAAHFGPTSLSISPTNPAIITAVSSLLLTLAATLLILSCANIGNLLLARAEVRRHEVAMRAALGATRGRLIRQMLTESILLSAFGCIGGLGCGIIASRAMRSISLHTFLPVVLDFHFDWRVFAYALIAAALMGLLVGITPALRAARANLGGPLHESGRTSTVGRQRLRSVLVIAQVASSLTLLIVTGLFVRSLEKAQHANLGFDPNHLLNASIDAHEAGYDENATREFEKLLLERARTLPGVQSASLAFSVPMSYTDDSSALANIDGYQTTPGEKVPVAGINRVSPDYFATMRIPLLQGRKFQDSDSQGSQRVAIVNQAFVAHYWNGQNPVGRHFSTTGNREHPLEVVGVAKNSREQDMFTQGEPFFYVPLAQDYVPIATLQLRTSGAPEAIAPEVIALIHSLEPAMPVFDIQPMTVTLDGANGLLLFQFAAALAASMGFIGLVLAVVGVYGVISYSAGQRTHEIGIRMALGAQPAQVLKMIVRQGVAIVGIGVIVGTLLAAAMGKLVSGLLLGIAALDPLTYICASAVLVAIAIFACYIPARRATRVDPMEALRYE